MEGLFKNKYSIASTRLQGYDYASAGLYFVTICIKDRECLFGDVINEKMRLSNIGIMAEKFWLEIPDHFPFVSLEEFVVMPNHLHGIIEIVETQNLASLRTGSIEFASHSNPETYPNSETNANPETQNFASLRGNKFGPQSKNLASIVRGFKVG